MEGFASLFSLSNVTVMPFWLLMILAPRWRWTHRIMASPFIAAAPVLMYAALVLPRLATLAPALARPDLPVIAGLLGSAGGATVAWLHFLALDLLLGRALFIDARARGVSAWIMSPLLLVTLLFAPLGLAAYPLVLAARSTRVRDWTRALFAAHRGLMLVAAGAVGLTLVALALQLVDGRTLGGASVWAKPAKFAASVAILGVSLAWIIGQLDGPRVARARAAGWLIAAVGVLELALIVVQAARGVPSHFNATTPWDVAVFAVMGAAITLLWLAELYVTVHAFRQPFGDPLRTWGIRLGLVGTLLGGAIGGIMPRPTPDQLATLQAGGHPAAVGAHAVGVPDGGPGLPVTRWSTEGGDLRAPHFLGLHALQALPLAAALLSRRRRRRSPRPIIALGTAWIGLTLVTLWQALRAQPLLSPDTLTLMAAGGVLFVAAAILLRRSTEPFAAPAPSANILRPSGG